MQRYGYIGTYTSRKSEGIYQFLLDDETGKVSQCTLFAPAQNPSAIVCRGNLLASAIEQPGRGAGVALWDLAHQNKTPISTCLPEQKTPCHLRFSGASLLATNYHEGFFTVYRMDGAALTCARQIACGHEAGCHQSISYKGYTLVPCLEQHQVRVFDRKYSPRGVILFPEDSGPRHGIFHPKDGSLWIVTERSHALYHFRWHPRGWKPVSCARILEFNHPQFSQSQTAAIHLSPDGRFVYVSTRGVDCISVFALYDTNAELIQQIPCGGKHPRDFVLSEDGRFVLILCRDSDQLLVFARNAETGLLGEVVSDLYVPEGSSICL